MRRTVLSFGLAICVLVTPSFAAPSRLETPFNRMLRLMDSTYARFARQADRSVDSSLSRIDRLESEGASPERIQTVIDETKAALEVSAAAMRGQLERFNTAADLVIDRHERAARQEHAVPTIDFDVFRLRADRRTDSLAARADLLLDESFAALDARTPTEEIPEEPF